MAPRTLLNLFARSRVIPDSRLLRYGVAALLMSVAFSVPASVATEAELPPVSVRDAGELVLNAGDIDYVPWQSRQLTGRVYLIQHIAGRASARAMNAPLIERIKAAGLPEDRYQTVTLVNSDDALWGTGALVRSRLEDSKTQFPWSAMVLDKEGVARSAWGLKPESSAIIVLDADNRVRWIREGALNDQEQQEVMVLIRRLLD